MMDEDVEVLESGTWTRTYEWAVSMAGWMEEDGCPMMIMRHQDHFELIAFSEGGCAFEEEYVSLEVGRRLYRDGHVACFVGIPDGEDWEDPATLARLEREQIWGISPRL
jgi:hypothetical protein